MARQVKSPSFIFQTVVRLCNWYSKHNCKSSPARLQNPKT